MTTGAGGAPMTTWWWVRHAPTHAKTLVGWTDLPADLSDTAMLARLEGYLPRNAVVVSSDLERAITTADAIQGGRARLENAAEIREINFGVWEGKTFAEVAQTHPRLSRNYWENPGETRPPNGESWAETSARVAGFVDAMNSRYSGQNIIAVAHFGVILTQLQRAGKMTAASALAFRIDNLSVTRLQFLNPDWRVLGVNTLA